MEALLKPKEQRFTKIDVPFIYEISGLAMIKLLNHKIGCTNKIKVKCVRNHEFLDVINNSSETIIFNNDETLSM